MKRFSSPIFLGKWTRNGETGRAASTLLLAEEKLGGPARRPRPDRTRRPEPAAGPAARVRGAPPGGVSRPPPREAFASRRQPGGSRSKRRCRASSLTPADKSEAIPDPGLTSPRPRNPPPSRARAQIPACVYSPRVPPAAGRRSAGTRAARAGRDRDPESWRRKHKLVLWCGWRWVALCLDT